LDGSPLIAAARLEGAWQRAIHTYKYRGRPQLAAALAGHLARAVQAAGIRPAGLTFIPLHPARQRARGFNQAERLARCLAPRLGLPLHAGLTRDRDTPPQVGLDQAAREGNVAGAFRWAAVALYVALVAAWAVVSVRTARGAWRGRLFLATPPQAETALGGTAQAATRSYGDSQRRWQADGG